MTEQDAERSAERACQHCWHSEEAHNGRAVDGRYHCSSCCGGGCFHPFVLKLAVLPLELSVTPRTVETPKCGYCDAKIDPGYCNCGDQRVYPQVQPRTVETVGQQREQALCFCGCPEELHVHGHCNGCCEPEDTDSTSGCNHGYRPKGKTEVESLSEQITTLKDAVKWATDEAYTRTAEWSGIVAERDAEITTLRAELDTARDDAAHAGFERDSDLNSMIRFTEDCLGMKLVGPCDKRDVFRLIEARVFGVEESRRTLLWKYQSASSRVTELQSQLNKANDESRCPACDGQTYISGAHCYLCRCAFVYSDGQRCWNLALQHVGNQAEWTIEPHPFLLESDQTGDLQAELATEREKLRKIVEYARDSLVLGDYRRLGIERIAKGEE